MRTLGYIGTFTRYGSSVGIYVGEFRDDLGRFGELTATSATDPSWLLVSPGSRSLYAAHHVHCFEHQPGGGITTYTISPEDGSLSVADRHVMEAVHPVAMNVSGDGRFLFVASTFGGAVSVFPLRMDGVVEEATDVWYHKGSVPIAASAEGRDWPELPTGAPMPHAAVTDPSGRFVLVPDARLDSVFVYAFDRSSRALYPATVSSVLFPPGSGPRQLCYGPSGDVVYVLTERSSAVMAFRFDDATGALERLSTVPLPSTSSPVPNLAAGLVLRAQGDVLYASNRGPNTVTAIATNGGEHLETIAEYPCGGDWPRSIHLTPSEKWLLVTNERSGSIIAFRVDEITGSLTMQGSAANVPYPTCVAFAVL